MLSNTLENCLLHFLYEKRAYQVQILGLETSKDFSEYAGTKGVVFDWNKESAIFREAFWRLVSKGLIAPGFGNGAGTQNLPWASITTYGIKCIENGSIINHDNLLYVQSLTKKVNELDPTINLYIEEALGCFTSRNYLACTSMIGAALEAAVLNMTIKFEKKLRGKIRIKYNKEVLSFEKIKTRLNNFLKFIDENGFKKGLDISTREKIESTLPAVANIIRITRNDVSHPTGRVIDAEETEAYLLLLKEGVILTYDILTKIRPTSVKK